MRSCDSRVNKNNAYFVRFNAVHDERFRPRCLFLSCLPPRRLDAVHRAAARECELRGTRAAAALVSAQGMINHLRSRCGFAPQQLPGGDVATRRRGGLVGAVRHRHVAPCGSGDDPTALHAALSLISTHCCAAAVRASPAETAQLLNRTGLAVLGDLHG